MNSGHANESILQPQIRNVKVAPFDSYGAHINRWAIIADISKKIQFKTC